MLACLFDFDQMQVAKVEVLSLGLCGVPTGGRVAFALETLACAKSA